MHVKLILIFRGGFLKQLREVPFELELKDPITGVVITDGSGLGINMPVNVLDLKTCFLKIILILEVVNYYMVLIV